MKKKKKLIAVKVEEEGTTKTHHRLEFPLVQFLIEATSNLPTLPASISTSIVTTLLTPTLSFLPRYTGQIKEIIDDAVIGFSCGGGYH